MKQFNKWFDIALNSNISDANSTVLSTVSSKGMPSGRVVLLKNVDSLGFTFFSNYNSTKAIDIENNLLDASENGSFGTGTKLTHLKVPQNHPEKYPVCLKSWYTSIPAGYFCVFLFSEKIFDFFSRKNNENCDF